MFVAQLTVKGTVAICPPRAPHLREFGAFLAPHPPIGTSDAQFRAISTRHLDKLGYDDFWCPVCAQSRESCHNGEYFNRAARP